MMSPEAERLYQKMRDDEAQKMRNDKCQHIWATQDEIGRPFCAACGVPWSVEFNKPRKGGPTESDPNRPYCKPDQSCCEWCCGN